MLQRKDIKKMFVSDNGTCWHERYVVYITETAACVTIRVYSEDDFENGASFDTKRWDYCKPIPEPKTRDMKPKEIVELFWKGIFIRRVDNPSWLRMATSINIARCQMDTDEDEFTFEELIEDYEHTTDKGSTWNKFEITEQ